MFKIIITISLVAFFVTCQGETQSSPYLDGEDVEEILRVPEKRTVYVDCLKGVGTCTEDGSKLKRVFREVLQKGYDGIDNIRQAAKRFIKYFAEKLSDLWDQRHRILDPLGIMRGEFYENVKKIVGKPLKWGRKALERTTVFDESVFLPPKGNVRDRAISEY